MVKDIIFNSFLPAFSMIIVSIGWWVISMKALASSIVEEDFVHYARLRGIPDNKIMTSYVARNAVLPQITLLALQIGGIFNGALVTEMLFGYPGVGTLIYNAVISTDYNLILGTISFSIIAVATTTLIVDILYPFLDPRIRYK
jgi:peptide/nickel transport system permease protein